MRAQQGRRRRARQRDRTNRRQTPLRRGSGATAATASALVLWDKLDSRRYAATPAFGTACTRRQQRHTLRRHTGRSGDTHQAPRRRLMQAHAATHVHAARDGRQTTSDPRRRARPARAPRQERETGSEEHSLNVIAGLCTWKRRRRHMQRHDTRRADHAAKQRHQRFGSACTRRQQRLTLRRHTGRSGDTH